jgi:hypothetical protein
VREFRKLTLALLIAKRTLKEHPAYMSADALQRPNSSIGGHFGAKVAEDAHVCLGFVSK